MGRRLDKDRTPRSALSFLHLACGLALFLSIAMPLAGHRVGYTSDLDDRPWAWKLPVAAGLVPLLLAGVAMWQRATRRRSHGRLLLAVTVALGLVSIVAGWIGILAGHDHCGGECDLPP